MAINFKKLKGQIHPFKPEVKRGYIFISTNEQKNRFIDSIAKIGSKRSLIKLIVWLILSNKDWEREFSL